LVRYFLHHAHPVTIDDDVAAILDAERKRTGETFRETLNRLLRRAVRTDTETPPLLPLVPGRLTVDISNVSGVLAELDDQKTREVGLY
jgi:hypothetical protein